MKQEERNNSSRSNLTGSQKKEKKKERDDLWCFAMFSFSTSNKGLLCVIFQRKNVERKMRRWREKEQSGEKIVVLGWNSDDSICIPLWRIFGFALVRILSFYRTSKDKLHVRKILSREIIALNGRYVRREERMVHYYFWYFTCIYNTIQLIHYNFLKMFSKLINLYSKSCNGEWNCTSDKSLTNSSTTCSILKIFE